MKLDKQQMINRVLGVMILAATIGAPLSSIAAPTPASPMVLGKAALTQKQYAKALQIYDAAAKTDQYKNSCECRLGLGKSLCLVAKTQKGTDQATTYKRAVKELRTAIRLGKGSPNAREANIVMMSLPKNVLAPKTGADTPMIALAHGLRGMDRGGEAAKPKVLEFTAKWCEPCKQLKPIIAKAKSDYADRVEFITVDIDDPKSEKIIEDYEVSPIPTLIFLDSSNQVITYSVGYSGENGLKAGIKKIVPTPAI